MYKQVSCVLLSCVLPVVLSCGGYKLDLKTIRNCGGGADILKLGEHFSSKLTDDCKVVPKGCVTASENINQAMITYDVVKNGVVPLKGKVDGCKEMESADEKTIQLVMTLAGIPPECPVPKGQRCASNSSSIDVSKHKNKMPVAAGSYKGKINSDHGGGKKSCIEFDADIKRK